MPLATHHDDSSYNPNRKENEQKVEPELPSTVSHMASQPSATPVNLVVRLLKHQPMDSAKSVLDAATTEYFAWLRQILTLSSTSLTVLIALRSQLVPEHPQSIWLLQLTWIALMLAIASSVWGTAGHHKLLLRGYESYRRAEQTSDPRSQRISVPRFYLLCGKTAPLAFLAAIFSLGVFGVLNIGTHSANTSTIVTPAPTTATTTHDPTLPAPSMSPNASTNALSTP